MRLWWLLVGALLVQESDALRSCTKTGQLRVPCEDELLLGKSDRFLLTLYGHTCYTMNIVSPQPLEVQFYDARDLKSGQSVRKLEDAANGTDALAALGDSACQNVLSCVQLQEGLSKASVYNLMISRWANTTEEEGDDLIPVDILLEHCDPVSPWHYVGLVFVGSIGFTSTMLLLCVVGEFVLGLRTITKLQKAAQRERFVELAQIDPLKAKSCGKEEPDEDSEEPTAPLMTTVVASDSEATADTASESEKVSPV
ncbi:hypothetical protein F441_22152 [Phytophthora nicotianae CJ01A1]|uniref:Uncharacterized protein n=11 Tax=Phytophthora nicotianae TaxID=4792 RepID=W2PEB8_PHYN3|nr:hypothetical protein PPTG_18946 [Phytophthora nicotianae INRA-310]ETI30631.1 hypothetical protein F443_22250 [Phytophthora nicotianae P1569]ETK71034.1 hypothetical protein L915_21640 [Phytophthora nicotianae]ETO59383.1 hypothetical protein F444_22243 [Phytophthora nicotianae P1976]ETP00424.1 hypothetical protein F441_22152 [Phytophthora nicotianae CJ01A1]ETP28580.1 hypothetical protein F442_22121 [Phytophthora nicotianae P10297]